MAAIQRYISKELTHFVGRKLRKDPERQYALLVRILKNGWLTSPPHKHGLGGSILTVDLKAKLSKNAMFSPQVICFCDIPLDDLEIHMEKYGHFGLAFSKRFLVRRGANPVFYIAGDSPSRVYLDPPFRRRFKGGITLFPVGPKLWTESIKRSAYFDGMLEEYHDLVLHHRSKQKQTDRRSNLPSAWQLDAVEHFLEFHVFSFMKCFGGA